MSKLYAVTPVPAGKWYLATAMVAHRKRNVMTFLATAACVILQIMDLWSVMRVHLYVILENQSPARTTTPAVEILHAAVRPLLAAEMGAVQVVQDVTRVAAVPGHRLHRHRRRRHPRWIMAFNFPFTVVAVGQ